MGCQTPPLAAPFTGKRNPQLTIEAGMGSRRKRSTPETAPLLFKLTAQPHRFSPQLIFSRGFASHLAATIASHPIRAV